MALSYTPTSELDAVNIMLGILGEAPLTSLSGSLTYDANVAQSLLHEASRKVQTESWHFNTELNYELIPDTDGYCNLPTGCIRFEVTRGYHPAEEITQRGTKLYDLRNHTSVFSAKVHGEAIMFLAFVDLPETARAYIATQAARIFQTRQVGSPELYQFNREDESMARARLVDQEGRQSGHSLIGPFRAKLRR